MLALAMAAMLLFGCLGIPFGSIAAADDATRTGAIELTVGTGKLQVQLYADDIVRVRYAPNGVFAEKTLNTYTVERDWKAVPYTYDETDTSITMTTARMKVVIDKAKGAVSYFTPDGTAVAAERGRTATPVTIDGKQYYAAGQEFASPENEYLYGFGNINDTMGIKNKTIEIVQRNTEKRTPMFYSSMGYGILFDMTSNGRLTWSGGGSAYKYTANYADSLDYYFFYGPEADEVISGYRTVTGTATMLPKNAFGYVQSRNRYGSQTELLNIVNTFRTKQIPLDNIVIDYFWWDGEFNNIQQWSGQWPNPAAMMNTLHEQHVSAAISIWPSFKLGTPTYQTALNGGIILNPNNASSQFGANYDPTTAANRAFYWNLIKENVWDKGLDSIWLDAEEPETSNWVSSGEKSAWGDSRPIGTIYPLLTTQGVYEGQRALAGNTKRVNTLSRGAVAGIQRYGIQSWSGDIAAGWEQFRKEITGVVNFSAAGLPYFSTDTGGYFGLNVADDNDREMFFRWLQFSTFNSIMRVHGADCVKEPWQFGSQYEKYIIEYIKLRERLVPYIYALAGAVTQDDYTIVRPMVFDFREDENVYQLKDQYMFGPSLMVCPVYTYGARSREVYFPAGVWYNFWSGEQIVSKGETMTVSAPLKQIPLFVRGGSIIPMGPENQYVDESNDPTEIRVYMGADGSFDLYEDEGTNYNYENGKFSNIPFAWDESSKTLTIGKRTGEYDGMLKNRTFNIVFVQPKYGYGEALSVDYQASVAYDGSAKTVTFDPNWALPTPPLDTDTLPVPITPPTPQKADKAMVGYWSFDEGEGARVSDSSGNFNSASLIADTANVWTNNGKVGGALQFTGGNAANPGSYVEAKNSDTLNMTTEISFSAWVNFTGSGHANILNKGGNGNNNPGYSFIILDGNRLQLEIQSAKNAGGQTSKTTAVAVGSFPKNAWHHVGFTWKAPSTGGDGIVRIYIDGKQVSDDGNTANYFAGPIGTNASGVRMGCSDVTEPNWPNFFTGYMDEASLYNYQLTAAEIASLAKLESITVANPTDIEVTPKDGGMTVTWKDPALDTLASVKVVYTPVDGGETKTVDVPKGTQTLTVDGLKNGAYYYVSLFSVLNDGRVSQGAYLVGYADTHKSRIECVVTHDTKVYGYVTNHFTQAVTGDLVIGVFGSNGKPVSAVTKENVTVSGQDMLSFEQEIGAFAENQTVQISFATKGGEVLASPVTIQREKTYDTDVAPEDLRKVLRAEIEKTIDTAIYTPSSVQAYEQVKKEAQALLNDPMCTADEILAMLNKLRTTLQLNPVYQLRGELQAELEKEINLEEYTPDSVAVYAYAKMEAKALLEKEDATAEELQAALTALRTALIPQPEYDYTLGDVDANGGVDSSDARMVLQAAVSKVTLDETQQLAADVDGDNKVDSSDARWILQYAVKKVTAFPAGDLL